MWRALLVLMLGIFPGIAFAAIDTDLQYGDRGAKVQELQEFLAERGFFERADATGNFFTLTLSAVKRFQSTHGVPSTGYVGPLTRVAIREATLSHTNEPSYAVPDLTPSSAPENVPASTAAAQQDDVEALRAKLADLLAKLNALKGGASATPAREPEPAFDFDPAWRDAVVNILCVSRYGGINDLLSGSGIIIDPRGIILTNAHVAHAFLFADWPNPSLYQCSIRIGSPAAPRYKAALLYIPSTWMQEELKHTDAADADKTVYGEHDYAFLAITGPTSDTVQMPAQFPYLPLYLDGALPKGSNVFLSGYPAEYFGGEAVQRNLYQVSSPSIVYQARTIAGRSTPEVIAFSGNIAAQHGASGGSVLTKGGALAGLLTFLDKDYGVSTAERILNAITTDYISRDLKSEAGLTLPELLTISDPVAGAKVFMEKAGSAYQQIYVKIWKGKGFVIPGIE